jgi:hypothetical protein
MHLSAIMDVGNILNFLTAKYSSYSAQSSLERDPEGPSSVVPVESKQYAGIFECLCRTRQYAGYAIARVQLRKEVLAHPR